MAFIRRATKIALVVAIPLEIAAFKMLDVVPFDFDPVPALTPLQATGVQWR